jgi:hypothetical protein
LCGAVRYELEPPFIRFVHCYCSRCRKATGGARATNIAVAPARFRFTAGADAISRWDLPSARSFATAACTTCHSPVPHATRSGREIIVPAGTLDDPPPSGPERHVQWASRVAWVSLEESRLPVEDG